MVHFAIGVVESMALPQLVLNHRGTGTPQYPPQKILALLLYCYTNGIMSSRKFETSTWHLVPVRYLTADAHPDHDRYDENPNDRNLEDRNQINLIDPDAPELYLAITGNDHDLRRGLSAVNAEWNLV